MSTREGTTTETAAGEGLKAVDDTASATLMALDRAYQAAMAEVADIAANGVRVLAPQVEEPAGQPDPQVLAGAADVPDPEVGTGSVPEPRMSPLVEALQALQVTAEPDQDRAPETEQDALVTEVVPRPRLVDTDWFAGRHADAETDQIPVQAA